jgi:glucosamine 6-phosphate synthetase-like amidotransferase/phosphosugar isomerase protein
MCSISGFLSNKPLSEETSKRLASALLYYGQSRGKQSAGAFIVGKQAAYMAKQAINPHKFIKGESFAKLFKQGARIGLFHTRYPTCGEKTDKQAQPFTRPDTVTVHNGYYFDIAGIRDKWGLHKKSGVDSELVTDFIESYGVDMLPDFLASTDGPSAIAAYHKGQVYLARGGNPLHYCPIDIDGCKVLVFASTFEQLESAIKYATLCEFPDIRELKENRLYQVGVKQLQRRGHWAGEIKRRTSKKARKGVRHIDGATFDMDNLIDRYSVVFDDDEIDLDDRQKDLVDIMGEGFFDDDDFYLDKKYNG